MNQTQINEKAQSIKLLILDVDGVLTDGMLNYGPEGELFKQFNVKDGVGVKLLQQYQIDVAVITAKESLALKQRMNDLSIKYFFPACSDKTIAFVQILEQLNLHKTQVAYVGDDVLDLPVMNEVGLSIAVEDAHDFVKQQADYITQKKGGQGVVREVADLILAAQYDLQALYAQLAQAKHNKIVQ